MFRKNDLKYLIAYLAPISAFIGIYLGGIWSFGVAYVAFVLIPIIELWINNDPKNVSPTEAISRSKNRIFDILLYLNVPILYGLLIYYFIKVNGGLQTNLEIIGMTINIGMILGITGINVAHELGHRKNQFEQTLSQILLLPSHYLHFFIEHNRGHHLNVGTLEDPATARYGETFYQFWWRSVTHGYIHAWKLVRQELQKKDKRIWSWDNLMIRFTIIQLIYLLTIALIFNPVVMILSIIAAVVGFSLLESVNYIEHYGLTRQILPNGRYEIVEKQHSWNSNHSLGRIFLYELTRHADHHIRATRKYQNLMHQEKSPQLPTGYPGSILVAIVPPLWSKMIHPRLESLNK